MRRLIFTTLAIFCLAGTTTFAQKIAAGAHLGFSKLTGDLNGGGLNWILDAKYYLNDKLAVGAEYNSSGMISPDGEGGLFGASVYGGQQFLVKGEYYLTTKKVRPYGALGLGYSKVSTPEVTINNTVAYPETNRSNFALSPRAGIMLGKFGIEFQYNIAGKTPKDTELSQANKKFNFWTLNLGYVYTFDFE